ncbi:MAG: M28 family peptidase [Saprospiraceae bacterium]|uniref:M28 family peptidase n=1 Tax=Candidatus Opimibacter skivensis TaxID=2982028 RepID=A0A9D7SW23_9BACT|nr:M28 family peptidase [Candidatus Opimibacter skivensis]
MKILFLFLAFFVTVLPDLSAQTNIHFTNPVIYNVLKGNYNPEDYLPAFPVDDPYAIATDLNAEINPDSLKATLLSLEAFHNRNTASDTISETTGIGAARKWVLSQFERLSLLQGSRLVTGYLQFDQDVCGMMSHKDVVAILPGRDISDPSSIIIEAHLDSRCKDNCDITCLAQGMEDNGSGVALILELARIMSRYVYDHTIVFMTVTGEEQGLLGANAYSDYALAQSIPIKAVLNNDIVGGIICGETSSPPSCPGLNNIDSTQVRLFSFGGFNSPHKALSRFIKLEYQEMIKPIAKVPMQVSIMSPEDRTGRGSDHIPFRENGFAAMRFCSANEHGNADVTNPDYHDRQHTSDDILGVDRDGDLVIDSFFVDFDYLARNAVVNGTGAAMAALGPKSPSILSVGQDGKFLYIEIADPIDYNHYLVGLRTFTNDFDTLYYVMNSKTGVFELPSRQVNIFISAAAIDSRGIESLFSEEKLVRLTGTHDEQIEANKIELLQNKPNPFDESTIISFLVNEPLSVQHAKIVITDVKGKIVKEIPADVKTGMNEVLFEHGYNATGTYFYSLYVDDQLIATKKMVFAN